MAVRQFQAGARNIAREHALQGGAGEATARGRPRHVAAGFTPEHYTMHQEQLRRLAQALEKLPPDQRRAVELHHLRGQSLTEVAEQMERSKDAVIGLLFRGMKKLRHLLADAERP
jgi:RNA polymerase sigma-70 factor (ECF subfamily)